MVLYVDRGGTSTKVLGKKLPSELPKLIPRLRKIVRSLPKRPESALVGSRGVWSKAERLALRKKLVFLAKKVEVVSDIEFAHRLAFGHRPGIVLNAGTGSIALGRNEKGKLARSGGLGPVMGDEGSAFWVGREFLKATKDISFLRKLIKDKDGVKKIAAYARRALKSNSATARKIQEEALAHLENLITKVQSILQIKKPAPVVLRGGLFNDNRFRKKFIARLRTLRFRV